MSIRYVEIQRMSLGNGPGLRTTLFCKGCPLACKWCNRPETILKKKQVLWDATRCIHCNHCATVCPCGAITIGQPDGTIQVNRRFCEGCFQCSTECPGNALVAAGYEATVSQLFDALTRDAAYYGNNGGVTLSGGEPLLQDDCVELLSRLHESGIQTAVATCGMLFPQQFERALPHIDYLLYDIKGIADRFHRDWTGQGNNLILRNYETAAAWATSGGHLWVRTPLIPGVLDSEEAITQIGQWLASVSAGIPERWELMEFDSSAESRYALLGQQWQFPATEKLSHQRLTELAGIAYRTGCCPDIRIVESSVFA